MKMTTKNTEKKYRVKKEKLAIRELQICADPHQGFVLTRSPDHFIMFFVVFFVVI